MSFLPSRCTIDSATSGQAVFSHSWASHVVQFPTFSGSTVRGLGHSPALPMSKTRKPKQYLTTRNIKDETSGL